MGVSINISADVSALLGSRVPDVIAGKVVSNLVYMPPLDAGHSSQAQEGITGPNMPYIETYAVHAVQEAVDAIAAGAEPTRALVEAMTDATTFALRQVVLDTPVDTGRAKGSWQMLLPDGSETAPQQGPYKQSFWRTPEGRKEAARRRGDRGGTP